MKTKVFAYKGVIGIDSPDNEGYLNDPSKAGQLGTVVRCDCVEISPEAKGLLENARREGGSFSGLMLTKHSNPEKDGKSSLGFLGFRKVMFPKEEIVIGRDCSKEVLGDMTLVPEMEIPEEFKAIVDKHIK